MKKKHIILLLVILSIFMSIYRWNSIKSYFIDERYYSILSALKLAKPHYKPYKSFYDIFTQEGYNYSESNQKIIIDSLKKISEEPYLNPIYKIPLITHQVYFTQDNSTKKLSDFYIENIKITINKLNNIGNWQHFIWTNNKKLFNEIDNAKIRTIDEFSDHPLYSNLLEMLIKGKESRAYLAEASDLLRLMALQKFGGLYKDLDYEIYNEHKLNDFIKKFDFIGGRERLSIKSYYGNSFIAAKPNHPIINKAIENLYRNHHLNSSSPIYLKYPSMEFDRIYFNGPPLITIAYFGQNNIEGNNDIILPQWMIYNKNFAHSKNKYCDFSKISKNDIYTNNNKIEELISNFILQNKNEIPKDGKISKQEQNIYYNTKYRSKYPIIGADMFCGSWVSGNNFKRHYYWNLPFIKNEN